MLANYARWYTFLPPQWSTIPPPLTPVLWPDALRSVPASWSSSSGCCGLVQIVLWLTRGGWNTRFIHAWQKAIL